MYVPTTGAELLYAVGGDSGFELKSIERTGAEFRRPRLVASVMFVKTPSAELEKTK
ncbi:Uncharacterised protein [uncultured archaeon]|nr:Uncharacterised protein [uncultured archaeon]